MFADGTFSRRKNRQHIVVFHIQGDLQFFKNHIVGQTLFGLWHCVAFGPAIFDNEPIQKNRHFNIFANLKRRVLVSF